MSPQPENTLFDVLDKIPDGYYEVDLRGRYTFVNQAICDFMDCDVDALIGKRFKIHTTPRCAQKTTEIFYSVYCSGQPGRMIDFEYLHSDRHISFIDLSIALVRDAQGQPVGFRGVARESTEAKQNELDLERYRNFVESIEDGCFEVDLDGTMTFINEAMCKIHGYAHKELLGMNHRGFASPEEAKKIYVAFNEVYRSGNFNKIFDYTIIHKDGTPRNLEVSASLIMDANGKPQGFRGITRDRTERKRSEMELQRYQEFVENVQDACFEVDLQGNITFFNHATVKQFGVPADRLMGMNNREYTTAETAKKTFAIYNKIFKTGQPAKIPTYEIIAGDGTKHFLDIIVSLITDVKGNPVGFRGISRDITDQVKSSAESNRLAELMHQSQRLETVTTLAGGVAHNFNNLFMSIQGNVSLIEMELGPEHPLQARCQTINKFVQRGSEFTFQLLSYADSGRVGPTAFNVGKVLDSAVTIFSKQWPDIQISQSDGGGLRYINGNRDQLQHVIMNLLVNAGQAMPNGGKITIGTQNVYLDEAFVRPYERKAGRYVKIDVMDTGIGMDETILRHVFEPFFTTKKPSVGAGLGLASAYGIVKSHDGIITVASERNKGTTFCVYLPEASQKEEDQSWAAPITDIQHQAKTVLLVDDDQVVTKATGKMIKAMGHQLLTAHSGQEAIAIFRKNQNSIDLVVMDIVMPGLAGDQAIKIIAEINPEIKTILVSGFIEAKDVQSNMPGDQQIFLQKPFTRNELQQAINCMLGN